MNGIKLSSAARTLLKKELRASSQILNHVKSLSELNKANKTKLIDLANKCGVDLGKIIRVSKIGLVSKSKRTRSDSKTSNNDEFSKDEQGNIPFQITIEALGQKRVLTAFYCYDWTLFFSIDSKGKIKPTRGEGRTTIKILDFENERNSDVFEVTNTYRDDILSIDKIKPTILEDPKISEIFPDEVENFFMNKIDEWVQQQAEASQ